MRVFGVGGYVGNLHSLTLQYDTSYDRAPRWRNWVAFHESDKFGRNAELRRGPVHLSIAAHNDRRIGFAQSRRSLGHGLQYGLQVKGRPADHLEHIAGRRLIFERLLQIARALTQFGDQPRILHGDDRLSCEILQQRDLLIGKRPNLLAVQDDEAENGVVPTERCDERRAGAAQVDEAAPVQVACPIWLLILQVEHVHNRLPAENSGAERSRSGRRSVSFAELRKVVRHTSDGGGEPALSIVGPELPESHLAQPHGLVEHGVEYRREIAGRGVNDLKQLGGGGLLLQSL